MTVNTDHIAWLGHDGFRLSGSRVVYIDPWEAGGPQADLILISHDHYDHCDPETVRALSGPKTQVVTEASAATRLKEAGVNVPLTVVEPGDEIEIYGVTVKVMPAYNVNKDFHPQARNYIGFLLNLDGLSVYHAGDSDFIPEMRGLTAQVALLPVSGTYVMTAEEAVQAALAIKPEVAIPMHYAKIIGDAAMAERFRDALKGQVEVVIKTVQP
ncbi:MAG: MBL fold metallo-hydrolase [Candidatus Adiutrix sp.]|jgi:L-ascorbate metabolism protein UlaG (beta-lactamase superfamily)|nr:MBL fold metallo-hydrolase [Candidatus Adiutrix sp.]